MSKAIRGTHTNFQQMKQRARRFNYCTMLCGPVMHPESKFRSMWNVLLAIFICYCGISVPLEIAFETDMVESMCQDKLTGVLTPRANCTSFQLWFWFNFMIDMWFISDIVVNSRTGYIREGHFVTNDWQAFKHYLQGSFLFDCLGSFPLNVVLMAATPDNPFGDTTSESGASTSTDVGRVNRLIRLVRMAKLAKLARMFKLAKYLEGAEAVMNPGVLAVIKLLMLMLLCCHWFGCLWWMISDLEMSDIELDSPWYSGYNNWHPPPWLKHDGNLATKYLHSFFWGAGMVTSMVPRDIEPTTALEAFVTTFTMFGGMLLNAFIISSLTTALASMNAKKELTGKRLEGIRSFLLIKSVPADIRSRILEYYEYLFTSSAALAELNMFSRMPPALNAVLNLAVNRKLTARCPLFSKLTSASLLTLIADLQPLVFVPGQMIIVEQQPLTAIYFINKGMVQLIKAGEPQGTLLRDNDNLGAEDYMEAAVAGQADDAINRLSARAVTYCDMSQLAAHRLNEEVATDAEFQEYVRINAAKLQERQRLVLQRIKSNFAGGDAPRRFTLSAESDSSNFPFSKRTSGLAAKLRSVKGLGRDCTPAKQDTSMRSEGDGTSSTNGSPTNEDDGNDSIRKSPSVALKAAASSSSSSSSGSSSSSSVGSTIDGKTKFNDSSWTAMRSMAEAPAATDVGRRGAPVAEIPEEADSSLQA